MKQSIAVAATAFLLAVVCAPAARAAAVPSFTATPGTDQTVTLDATESPCEFGPCGYNWKYYTDTTNRLGIQIGREAQITFRFPESGWHTVVLTVSSHCYDGSPRACPGSVTMQVYAPAAETVDPHAQPPPAATDPPPEVVDAQPAVVEAGPPAEAAQPAVADPPPATVDEQPAVVDPLPAAVDAQPPVVDAPPAAVDEQPA